MTGVGIAAFFIAWLLKYMGIEGVENGEIAEVVTGLVQIGGFIMMVWGQMRRKDLKLGMIRR